jgi:hypothetical protein
MRLRKGELDKGPRQQLLDFAHEIDLTALRYHDWKVIFKETNRNLFNE